MEKYQAVKGKDGKFAGFISGDTWMGLVIERSRAREMGYVPYGREFGVHLYWGGK